MGNRFSLTSDSVQNAGGGKRVTGEMEMEYIDSRNQVDEDLFSIDKFHNNHSKDSLGH